MRNILGIILAASGAYGEFRAAAVKTDITPQSPQWLLGYAPRKSTGTLDRIYHRILAMDDGKTQFFLVSTDLCLFSPGLYDDVALELQKRFSVEPRNFWWSVTHTHSAPEIGPRGVYDALLKGRSDHEWDQEYTQFVISRLIAGVQQAREQLQPARLQTGLGFSAANINRRARDLDGTVTLGLNPDGPTDRQIGILRLEKPDGSPIAIVANYAIHGTVLSGKSELISGDAPGVAAAHVEQKIGGTTLFINGAAGNTAPIYSVYPDPKSGHLSQFRVLLGDRILQAIAGLSRGINDITIQTEQSYVESRLKPGLEWPRELERYSRPGEGGTIVRLPLRFLKIGDTVIWAAPVELFSEIATTVRSRSPFSKTFYFGYTNGWFGYVPTAPAFREGGYEPATSIFTEAIEADLIQHVDMKLQGMRR